MNLEVLREVESRGRLSARAGKYFKFVQVGNVGTEHLDADARIKAKWIIRGRMQGDEMQWREISATGGAGRLKFSLAMAFWGFRWSSPDLHSCRKSAVYFAHELPRTM
jgi:hypothetical protein